MSDDTGPDPGPDPTVRRVEDGYVLESGGRRIGAAYVTSRDNTLTFTHTEIDPAFEGQHLGSRLIAGALDDVRARGESVVARCPFVVAYLRRHREYLDLVDAQQRPDFD